MEIIVERLKSIAFEDGKEVEKRKLFEEIISQPWDASDLEIILDFCTWIKDVVSGSGNDPLYNASLEKIVELADSLSEDFILKKILLLDQAVTLMSERHTLNERLTGEESYKIYNILKELYSLKFQAEEDRFWVSTIELYAQYVIVYAKINKDYQLMNSGISAYFEVLDLYKLGQFPDYWNVQAISAATKYNICVTFLELISDHGINVKIKKDDIKYLVEEVYTYYVENGPEYMIESIEKLEADYNASKG